MSDSFNPNNNNINEDDKLNPSQINYKNPNKKNIKIYLFLIIIVIYSLIIFLYFKLKASEQIINKYLQNPIKGIDEILPKINLNEDNYIPTKNQILESRELYINDKNLIPEYIQYFKTLSDTEESIYRKKENEGKKFNNAFKDPKPDQLNYSDFYYLCRKGKFLNTEKIQPCNDPLISIILPSYNKASEIVQSIRSIQNQSFKKFEIIIVDDCSTDNPQEIYKNLLNSDPRIRIFYHQKNMGVWRSRLDGFLYSRGKYILHFDPGDYYSDNYILEDGYNLVSEYHLDSLRFSLMEVYNRTNIENKKNTKRIEFENFLLKIIYGKIDFPVITVHYGSIWNRLTRASIFTKGLYLLDEYTLNAYKNLWEDRWWNQLANKLCYSNLLIDRVGYLYFRFDSGEGTVKLNTDEQKFKIIKEFIYFLLFDYQLTSKYNDKKNVIDFLKWLDSDNFQYFEFILSIKYLNKKFPIFNHLIDCLLNDPFVYPEDKKFLKELLSKTQKRLGEL
jgi:glycosyltransferase involved in cell wall biosynthesis